MNCVVVNGDTSMLEVKVQEPGLDEKLASKADVDHVHEEYLTEHQDISHLASKKEVEAKFVSKERYKITNTPEGTLVDYRDKEIRIMCPQNAVFVKQQVGEGGNANMYYMSFITYAPENAVTFKEGDKGVIIDEVLDFENTAGTGIDEYGRKYKIHWFALASYNSSNDTWSYFGKTSNANKYIGWNYVVEWYDVNGVVIESDSIRINLSNEDCHSIVEPHFIAPMKAQIESKADNSKLESLEKQLEQMPSFAFNAAGELVVTINGISKVFVPKSE